MDYHSLCLDLFGFETHHRVWEWLFAPEWGEVDNTIQGAIGRINYLTHNRSLPEQWNPDFDDVDNYWVPTKAYVQLYQEFLP